MKTILYATTNFEKFRKAEIGLAPHGIELTQIELEIPELQTTDGEAIVREKALSAYQLVNKPVLVSDDSWDIAGLNGFPGPNMKQCNHYLVAEDWLRLMNGVKNRAVTMTSFMAFCNGSDPNVFSHNEYFEMLQEKHGSHQKSPILEVVAFVGQTQSLAEYVAGGMQPLLELNDYWKNLAQHILNSE